MKKNPFHKEEGEPEPEFQVAPMADMLFVLLVFFMSITTTEVMQMQIDKLELPYAKETAKEEEAEEKQRKDIVINLRWNQETRTADIIMSGYKTFDTPEEIIPLVEERLNENPLATVLIRADQDTEYEFVSQIMRAVGKAGVGAVSFGVITGGGEAGEAATRAGGE